MTGKSVPQILLAVNNPQLDELLRESALAPSGFHVTSFSGEESIQSIVSKQLFDLVIFAIDADKTNSFHIVQELLKLDPACSVILISQEKDADTILQALRVGASDLLTLPLKPSDVIKSVNKGLARRKKYQGWVKSQTRRHLTSLNQYIKELKEIGSIGLAMTSSLDLDHVLTVIVETAVKVTGAEEGSLLILDEESGELFMRAARNFQDEFVHTFRLPVSDTLAGDVIRTGKPVIINEDTPHKIKTTYLVHTLMYVPLKVREKVIGVLGIDNREKRQGFTHQHLSLVTTLADYAAVAIDNANLYRYTELERNKLDAILTQIEDGVIVVGDDNRVILINRMARLMLGLSTENFSGKPVEDVFQHETLLGIFDDEGHDPEERFEIFLDDGYILSAHSVKIPGIGNAVTMQDITYFKELDRVKSEFVNTVSHDLRSPLTAILGYIELISRVGDVNEQQREFINRVQISVRNISELINALLKLGRIEAGFETEKELVPFGSIVKNSIENFSSIMADKKQKLSIEIPEPLPAIEGNPVHFRQIAENLISNAIRYTPNEGLITVRALSQQEQIIFQVADTGMGIPIPDQAYIFQKFYRGSNIPDSTDGTGLGLAIVKSIVDNYQGRIWVESTPGGGSCFTVVLPLNQKSNISA